MADDEVAHEVNVYLSKGLAEQLYLMQYPIRPSGMTYDSAKTVAARVKPKQQKVELELNLNTGSPNYAQSKGEQIALNVDGPEGAGDADKTYKTNMMDKQLLCSMPAGPPGGCYAAGLLKDGELHLTPVRGIIQMRPSFTYMDKAENKLNDDTKLKEEGESSQDEEEEVEAKPVTVRFSRPESEEAKARRMASYNYLLQAQDKEPWVNVHPYCEEDDLSQVYRNQLTADTVTPVSEFHSTPTQYLKNLVSKSKEAESEKPDLPTNVLSMTQLRNMPITDQIRAMLINAKVIQFSQLMDLLPKNTDETSALRALQQVAMLVQGCWVVKSDVLYPKDVCSPHSGASSEVLCRARDYIMWKFTQHNCIIRKDLTTVIKLNTEDVKEILQQMSHIKLHHGWQFKMSTDNTFVHRYPEVVQRQEMLWDAKYQQLAKQLKVNKDDGKKTKEGGMSPPTSHKRRRTTSRSRRSVSDHSDTDTETPNKPEANHIDGDMDTSRLGPPPSGSPKSRRRHSSGTDHINNVDTAAQIKKELHLFVAERLESLLILTFSELKRQLQLKQVSCPPGHVLGSGISDKMLEQAVYDCGGMKIKNEWPQKSTPEGIFSMKLNDDPSLYNKIKKTVFKYFETEAHMSIGKLKRKLTESYTEEFGLNDIKKVLKDYCVTKGALYYLKGTAQSAS